MKAKILKRSSKASLKVQEFQTVAIIALAVIVLVLTAVVAVLFAQVNGHRRSIEGLHQATTGLPTSDQK